ncbi:hypothetical protein D9Q98_010088 [Chlorella vulgaris]|uniref:Heme oxygenase n=1 Tax=Chlorella vulgaris TaxID=3077 RepID=A0A9D4YWU0_CHLVU|nr:hypothetical protein D9Q98_010088 [Chlorella vulgaris]
MAAPQANELRALGCAMRVPLMGHSCRLDWSAGCQHPTTGGLTARCHKAVLKRDMAAHDASTPPGLTERLIKNSAKAHSRSNALLLGKVAALFIDRELYGKAIGCFYLVFVELESALHKAMATDERVESMRDVLEPLWRVPAYEADLQFYLGPNWREQLVTSPAIEAYIARLRELSEKQPVLLLAHAFTQHMAGLSGGRILKRLARKHMKLPEDKGTAIFEFPGGLELKDAFKRQLDVVGAGLNGTELQAMLDEQLHAFAFNIAIMQEFKVGFLQQLAAPLRLLPPNYVAAASAVAVAVAVALVAWRWPA